jgi:TetR/AcrR family transcriptional repressor of nem operon
MRKAKTAKSAKAVQKERTHREILASGGRLLRTGGISGASVAEVMRGAGLTVGGFYAHFSSKDALVESLLRSTMGQVRESLLSSAGDLPARERVERTLERYLSAEHRDHPERGCPVPAALSEVTRQSIAVRRAFAQEIDKHLAVSGASSRQAALATLALMYGGLALARALKDTPLSDEVLKACLEYARSRRPPSSRKAAPGGSRRH